MNEDRSMSRLGLDLEVALRDLGGAIDAPVAAGLAGRVRARIEAERPARATRPWWRTVTGTGGAGASGQMRRVRRSLLLAAAAVLLVAAAVTAAIGYGLPGLRILFGPPPSASPGAITPSPTSPPFPSPAAPGADLGLGRSVTLDEAAGLVAFEIALPADPGLGPPDAVYLSGGRLALAWGPDPALPGTAREGLGLLLVEIDGRVEPASVEKLIRTGTHVEPVTVAGAAGYWIAGAHHFLSYIAPDGSRIEDTMREVGNALLWTRDGVTHRLEGELTLDQAIKLAESLS